MSGDSSRRAVVDPYGALVTADKLPAPNIVRWVPRRKAQVVSAIRGGLLSREEACKRYGITDDELLSWETLLNEHGLMALRATRVKRYRQAGASTEEEAQEG